MKKILFTGLTLLSLLWGVSPDAKAANDEGPYLRVDVGGYSRRIEETCSQCVDILKGYGYADSTRLLMNLGIHTGFLDAYATLGGATLSIYEFDGYHGKMSPVFGGGFKMLMYQSPTYEHFTLFINPDFIYFKTRDTILFDSCQGITPCTKNISVPIIESHDISWTEYAIRVGGSSRYGLVETYGGIKLSFVEGQETGPVFGTADIKEMDNFGLFFGAHFDLDPRGMASFFGEIGGGDSAYLKVGILSRF
jgi:hypothetical protein